MPSPEPEPFAAQKNRELVLAVDFGGTKVEAALVDSEGHVLPSSRFRSPTGRTASADELVASVASVTNRALAAIPEGVALKGIGIGSAGPIDRDRGLVSPVNLEVWREFPLRDTVAGIARSAGHEAAAILRLDGVCITLAEHWVGAACGHDNVMGMIVSTGIGGGLVLAGTVATGFSGNAGHIGQVEVAGFTEPDAPSTLEEIASGPHTVTWARSQGWAGNTGEELAVAYAQGEPVAKAAVERSGTAIGRAIASVSTLLDLEVVVIGGGFSRVSPDLFDFIRAGIDRYARFDYAKRVQVLPSGLDTDGPLIGAAALVWRGVTR
jgi:glucokinase